MAGFERFSGMTDVGQWTSRRCSSLYYTQFVRIQSFCIPFWYARQRLDIKVGQTENGLKRYFVKHRLISVLVASPRSQIMSKGVCKSQNWPARPGHFENKTLVFS